jgi:four helix bundle protein
MDFAEAVYRASKAFPKDETFGLRLQLRRAAVSVASNIAEGHGRINRRDYARFVLVARGSLKEAETQVRLAQRLSYFSDSDAARLLELTSHLNRLLTGLKNKLRE